MVPMAALHDSLVQNPAQVPSTAFNARSPECYQAALNRTELGLQLLDPNDLESNDSRAYPPSKEVPKHAANGSGAASKWNPSVSCM